ncbi:MAG: hypothetical protein ACN4GR_10725 [Arenicellales bacterium]
MDEEQRKKLTEWMVDRSVDTDIDSQVHTHRKEMLDEVVDGHGGRKHFWRLFPGGRVSEGMRLAGCPLPPHSGDVGFGTVR